MKKVLIITYYWPPAGGPGVQRWLKFVKYLRDFDVEPFVYIPENPHYPIQDESLLNEIPAEISILKQPIREPYNLAGLLSSKKTKRISSGIIQTKDQSFLEKTLLWIRGNLFIPDARKYWIKPSVKVLLEVVKKEKIQTIITTGPPHSMHLIGYQLKQKLNIDWLADFRDPWTSIGYHKKLRLTEASRRKHKHLEKSVLNGADKLIVTSETTKKEFALLTKKPISVITNGYDSDYEGGQVLDEKFTVAHIGSLLTGRNPKNLWKVLAEFARENRIFKESFQLVLVGVVSEDVLESIYSFGLEPHVKLSGYVTHQEARVLQQKAQVLLLAEIDSEETKGIIPGKLFEYMAARRPILAIGPKDWEVARMIRHNELGVAFDYAVKSELKEVILEWFAKYRESKLQLSPKNIQQFSRRALTEKLAELL